MSHQVNLAALKFMYGTAWKEERTSELTELALSAGFRAIDTANQRKHYDEAAVGVGLHRSYERLGLTRADIFLQTKFTYQRGQDHRLPYDPKASLTIQVEQSFASSLAHLNTEYLDSYVLHGPASGYGLTPEDDEVWQAMESLQQAQKVRHLGISNINLRQLETLCARARVKPHFVQNRCFAHQKWNQDVRSFCHRHQIVYQGFSLLTANLRELSHPFVASLLSRHSRSLPEIVFRFATQIGMLPLTGTSNLQHMKLDLSIFDFELAPEELQTLEAIVST